MSSIRSPQPGSAPGTPSGSDPVYHELSPKLTLATRMSGGAAALMVLLAFIFCLVQGTKNSNFYLLCCNLIISSLVGIVNAWWYRRGDLSVDKYWYMMVLSGIIIFQCLATDIFVFNLPTGPDPTSPPSFSSAATTAPLTIAPSTTAANGTAL